MISRQVRRDKAVDAICQAVSRVWVSGKLGATPFGISTHARGASSRSRRFPARHCGLNGPNRVTLSPSSAVAATGETTEGTHQVKRLSLTGLPRILAEADADPLAVLRRGIEKQSVDVGPGRAPYSAAITAAFYFFIAVELDADTPIAVVKLSFGRGEIPIPDNVEIRWSLGVS